MAADDPRVIRLPRGQASEPWEAVLASAAIPYRTEPVDGGWALVVDAPDFERALALLRDEAVEQAQRPAGGHDEPSEFAGTWGGVAMAAAWLAVAGVSGTVGHRAVWLAAGTADAARVVGGEWWRALTALTLHADASHLLNNVLSTALLGTALGRVVGPGVASWAIVVSGTGGNLLNAWVHGAHHDSLGASTAVFGAVGTLAGLSAVQGRGAARPRRGAWIPIAAGLAILALYGTGERTDHGAHLFGFVTGLVVGAALGFVRPWWPGPRWQPWLTASALAVLAGAWWLALRAGS